MDISVSHASIAPWIAGAMLVYLLSTGRLSVYLGLLKPNAALTSTGSAS